MARHKRSISLPADLDVAVAEAAGRSGTTVSAWLAATAAHRLRIEAGRAALAEWEAEHGALSDAELQRGRERARAILQQQENRRRSA